jgi:hypothetical protein
VQTGVRWAFLKKLRRRIGMNGSQSRLGKSISPTVHINAVTENDQTM